MFIFHFPNPEEEMLIKCLAVCFTLFHSLHGYCTITTLAACLLFSALIFKEAISCLYSNIPSKHSSWEPAGGGIKHYYCGGFIADLWTEAISFISSRVTKPAGVGFSFHVMFFLRSFSGLFV